jgi:hypothetical protein
MHDEFNLLQDADPVTGPGSPDAQVLIPLPACFTRV